jgi:glycosyltransferase involved in cell wall biosynthesis
MLPQISIIIPVYNAAPYLRDCLDSVINQTMSEIQIICINDGSTDNSSSILEEYADRDSRILFINKTHNGVSFARNIGLTHAEGKYVLFVDSDDTVDMRLCEKVYHKAKQSNADIILFFNDAPNGQKCIGNRTISTDDKIRWEEKKHLSGFGTVCGKLWRNDFLQKYDLKFYEQLHRLEDVMFYWQGLQLATKVAILPENLYHYYLRENSLSLWHGKYCLTVFDDFAKCKSFLVEHGLYKYYKSLFLRSEVDILFGIQTKVTSEYRSEFLKKLKDWIDDDEIIYMRHERYIDYSVTYFFYRVTGDWGIFVMFIRRRIRAFLGETRRSIIRVIKSFLQI